MWIDTHCHLNATDFADELDDIVRQTEKLQVSYIVIPSINREGFFQVRELSRRYANCVYALGIHPACVDEAKEDDLLLMKSLLEEGREDPKLVGIGEIGLDFYIPELKEGPLREKQEYFYQAQLKMAKEFELPVLLHSRRSVDAVLKYLRQIKTVGGIAHAFNGSFQQAKSFIDLGFMLSFCGSLTYERAQHLKRLARELPLSSLVIETDAPDMPPSWVKNRPNRPDDIVKIGEAVAALRGISPEKLALETTRNAIGVLPRLAQL